MRHIARLAVFLAIVGCKKKESEAPGPSAGSSSTTPGSAAPPTPAAAPTPAAPPPAPAPVAMTAEELAPTCAKLVSAELAARTHGATEVKDDTPKGGMPRGAICSLLKGTEPVGSITIACKPDLDVSAIERERAAMTKAQDLPEPIGRGGYRLSSIVFYNDDETPCRLQVAFNTLPPDAELAAALRAIAAAVTPAALRP